MPPLKTEPVVSETKLVSVKEGSEFSFGKKSSKHSFQKFVHNLVHLISGEDLSKEEHLDNELLWNLKLLSEVSNILTLPLIVHRSKWILFNECVHVFSV